MWHWLLAVSPDPNPWAQLGIASIVCALLSGIAWTLWRRVLTLQAEKDDLYRQRIDREQFLSDRLAPLLSDAIEILGSAPMKFETALSQAQRSTQAGELDRLVEKLESMTRDLRK